MARWEHITLRQENQISPVEISGGNNLDCVCGITSNSLQSLWVQERNAGRAVDPSRPDGHVRNIFRSFFFFFRSPCRIASFLVDPVALKSRPSRISPTKKREGEKNKEMSTMKHQRNPIVNDTGRLLNWFHFFVFVPLPEKSSLFPSQQDKRRDKGTHLCVTGGVAMVTAGHERAHQQHNTKQQ